MNTCPHCKRTLRYADRCHNCGAKLHTPKNTARCKHGINTEYFRCDDCASALGLAERAVYDAAMAALKSGVLEVVASETEWILDDPGARAMWDLVRACRAAKEVSEEVTQ